MEEVARAKDRWVGQAASLQPGMGEKAQAIEEFAESMVRLGRGRPISHRIRHGDNEKTMELLIVASIRRPNTSAAEQANTALSRSEQRSTNTTLRWDQSDRGPR
jgi:hypothetical protein